MKKLTSIILILVILSSCIVFSGCGWINRKEYVFFTHGDDFTDKDIAFVRSLHGKKNQNVMDIPSLSFDSILAACEGMLSFYLMELDVENPYFICAYSSPNQINLINLNGFNVSAYSWYKFNNAEEIADTVNGKELKISYRLIDCKVKDISYGKDFDESFVFYSKTRSDTLQYYTKYMLLFMGDHQLLAKSVFNTIDGNLPYQRLFQIYEDKYGSKYLPILDEQTIDEKTYTDIAREELGIYYDIFASDLVDLPEWNCETEDFKEKYLGISIDTLSKWLVNGKVD